MYKDSIMNKLNIKQKIKKDQKNSIIPIRKNSDLVQSDQDKQIKQNIRSERSQQKEYDYYYKYFTKLSNTIPPYILKNLKKMPNNKGYIWKGMQCFGELPADNNYNTVLFENAGKDLIHIHEWTKTEYKIYEKYGKNNKILLHKEIRRIIPSSFII